MIKKNYQSSNLLNFHAHHLNLWFFCANSSFLLRLIVKFSLVLGLFLNYNYNAFWSILLPLPFIIYLNTFVSYINYIFKYICLLHLFKYICLIHLLYIWILFQSSTFVWNLTSWTCRCHAQNQPHLGRSKPKKCSQCQ